MKKLTKAEFLRHVAANGLGMRGVFSRKSLEEVAGIINSNPIEEKDIQRDKCEVKGQKIARETPKGKSYLTLDKEATIYSYKNHFIVFSEHPATPGMPATTSAIVYV